LSCRCCFPSIFIRNVKMLQLFWIDVPRCSLGIVPVCSFVPCACLFESVPAWRIQVITKASIHSATARQNKLTTMKFLALTLNGLNLANGLAVRPFGGNSAGMTVSGADYYINMQGWVTSKMGDFQLNFFELAPAPSYLKPSALPSSTNYYI